MTNRRKFNEKMHKWLVANGKNYTCKELIIILNDKFNENFTLKQMQQYFWHHDDVTFKYEKANKSHNNNPLPIGSERIKGDGMVQVKIGPKKWVYKQRKIYKDYYGVKLKDDEYVIFLDQNRNNFDISNLKVISRRESAIMANNHMFSTNSEVTKTGTLVAKTIIKLKEVKNNG